MKSRTAKLPPTITPADREPEDSPSMSLPPLLRPKRIPLQRPPAARAAGSDRRLVKERGVEVGEIVELLALDRLVDIALDRADVIEVFGGEDGEGVALLLRAAGAADAVDVILRVTG